MKDCPVAGCDARIDKSLLTCRDDWRAIPQPLRQEVWRTYRGGRGILDEVYLDAAAAAIEAAGLARAAT